MIKSNTDFEIETGTLCNNCDELTDVLTYCYPETSWTDAALRLGVVKKIPLCHECAMSFIRLKLGSAITNLIEVAAAKLTPSDEPIVHVKSCIEDEMLDVNYLVELDVKIDPTNDNDIKIIAGNVVVGRKRDRIAVFMGLRSINPHKETKPKEALDELYDSLLQYVFDIIPRVDYTPMYMGDEDGLQEFFIYPPLLGKHHPAIDELGIASTEE